MLGTGLFTHARHLVNVPTWFVSLLLACYLILFLVRLSPWPRAASAVWALLLALWAFRTSSMGQSVHVPTFFIASALAALCPPSWRAAAFLAAGAAFLLRTPWSDASGYPALAFLAVGLALLLPRLPAGLTRLASYSYEFYLVHGITLVGTLHLLPARPALAIALGLGLAALAAVLVQRTVAKGLRWLGRWTGG
jgi:peptidoglycan/LPS O-acetylase OafA/YrhL